VTLLSDALNHIPIYTLQEMTERLADAYVKTGDYDSAISLFEGLTQSGVPQFHILQDLAILLEAEGEYERAARVLEKMADLFPNDYRVPMRQAFLEADRQSVIENERRDYGMVAQYYEDAARLYAENLKSGDADSQMRQLESIIEQLKSNNWIN